MRNFYISMSRKENIFLFVLTLLLAFGIYAFSYSLNFDPNNRYKLELFRAFKNIFLINMVLFAAMYLLFKNRFSSSVRAFAVINVIIFFINFFLLNKFGILFGLVAIDALVGTNLDEAAEFSGVYLDAGVVTVGIVCALAIAFILRLSYFVKSRERERERETWRLRL